MPLNNPLSVPHTLTSHTTKAHAELTGVTTALHHTKYASGAGNYTGDSSVNRALAHGLGVTPKLIVITDMIGMYTYRIHGLIGQILYMIGGTGTWNNLAVTIPNGTNFYVGNATNYYNSANFSGQVYYWVALE